MRLSIHSCVLALLAFGSAPSLAQEDVPTAQEAGALTGQGRFAEAAVLWGKRSEADPSDGQASFQTAYNLHMSGDLDAAHDAHLRAARFPQFNATALYNHACVHALRDEKDAAFAALAEARQAGFGNLQQVRTDSDLDNLRGDARFAAFVRDLQPSAGAADAAAPVRLDGRGAPAPAPNLAALPAARRFDFYLGDWDLTLNGEVERRISTARAFDGNGLLVTSRDAQAGEINAHSFYLYVEEAELWRQVWLASDGTHVVLEGGLDGDAMILNAVSENGAPKSNARSVFKDIDADSFTYEWQETEDAGKTWNVRAARRFERQGARR